MQQLLLRFCVIGCLLLLVSTEAKHLGKEEEGDEKPILLFFQALLKGQAMPWKKACDNDSSEETSPSGQPEEVSEQPDLKIDDGLASEAPEGPSDVKQSEAKRSVICVEGSNCPTDTEEEIVEVN